MTDKSEHFDLIILGSGSGNSIITPWWDEKKVAIVDGGVFGGTCLNNGCIPSKMFLYPAEPVFQQQRWAALGTETQVEYADYRAINQRVFSRIDAISDAGVHYRQQECPNTTLYRSNAQFTGPKTLVTEAGERLSADTIVIATGAHPVLPDIPGIDHPVVHTSDDMMRLAYTPEKVAVLGGGFIACEAATMLRGAGAEVTQIIRGDQVLRGFDSLVREQLTQAAATQWQLLSEHQVQAIEPIPGNEQRALLHCTDKAGQANTLEVDTIIVAYGRHPNTENLGVAAAGIGLHDDGRIRVNEHQQALDTRGNPLPGVWAVGDVSSPYQLKHVANHETRTLMYNLEHGAPYRSSDHSWVPSAVFSHPQVAAVGLSEEEAIQRYGAEELSIKTQYFRDTAYGWAMGAEDEFCKVIIHQPSQRLIGAHIVGEQAATLIQPLIAAGQFQLDLAEFIRGQYWIHPALTEVVENALIGAVGVDY